MEETTTTTTKRGGKLNQSMMEGITECECEHTDFNKNSKERDMEETTTTTTTKRGGKLNQSMMEGITERLSAMENLYFPRSIQETAINPVQRRSILFNLLSTDTAVFLERYGSLLTSEEICEFDVLKDDYEINWHLNHLRTLLTPTTEEVRSRSVTVKNRRRAYLNKLVSDGKYFSEDAMRDREPYLHHEYVGKFQDPSGRNMRRPGEKWSETLSRRAEEAILVEKIRGEQERLGVDEKDWVGNVREEEEEQEEEEEEEEEEEDEEEDEAMNAKDDTTHPSEVLVDREPTGSGQCATGIDTHEGTTLCTAEMEDQMDQFTHIMQQKFLSGEDSQHMDYARIDNDETLDDHWFREANHDAEEKYFDDD